MRIRGPRIAVCLLLLAGGAGPVFAANAWHTSTITQLYPWQDGRIALKFASASGCVAADQYHYLQANQEAVTEDAFKHMYAAALLAKATEASVTIFYDTATCYIRRMIVK